MKKVAFGLTLALLAGATPALAEEALTVGSCSCIRTSTCPTSWPG